MYQKELLLNISQYLNKSKVSQNITKKFVIQALELYTVHGEP